MVRPRQLSDAEILKRIDEALSRRQESKPWDLASAARAAEMSSAGLLKRFGSKRGLLEALTNQWIASIPQARDTSLLPLEELSAYVDTHFGVTSRSAALVGLSELLRDVSSQTTADLLRQGWDREISYFSLLLEQIGLPNSVAAKETAALLLDLMHGHYLRAAVDADMAQPSDILKTFLKGFQ